MFIINPTSLSKVYKCNKRVANYLILYGVPLLSQDESGFYFSETKKLKECLDKAPLWIRWLIT